MPRAISWIDAAEAARLVASLSTPIGAARPEAARETAARETVSREVASREVASRETASRETASRETASQTASRELASALPVHHEPVAVPEVEVDLPPFELPRGSVFQRVQALCGWIDTCLTPASVYLADEHGLLVHGIRSRVEYGAVMAPLLQAMRQMEQALGVHPHRGSVFVRDSEVLSWVECVTPLGQFCLGILSPLAVRDDDLARVQVELARTLEGGTT
jgi:hypothetical protein